ncbi:hypothetical protein GGI07_003690 [Coemansia sp. Benny D115]|nr:hypothetical protein GGI07_003690 [Coemansia sp. Benny D115]
MRDPASAQAVPATNGAQRPVERVFSVDELQRLARVQIQFKDSISKHYKDLDKTYAKANERLGEKDLEKAYIYYMRYTNFVMNDLPKHKDFGRAENREANQRHQLNALHSLERLEKLQPILRRRYDEYMKYIASVPRPAAAVSTYSMRRGISVPPLSQFHINFAPGPLPEEETKWAVPSQPGELPGTAARPSAPVASGQEQKQKRSLHDKLKSLSLSRRSEDGGSGSHLFSFHRHSPSSGSQTRRKEPRDATPIEYPSMEPASASPKPLQQPQQQQQQQPPPVQHNNSYIMHQGYQYPRVQDTLAPQPYAVSRPPAKPLPVPPPQIPPLIPPRPNAAVTSPSAARFSTPTVLTSGAMFSGQQSMSTLVSPAPATAAVACPALPPKPQEYYESSESASTAATTAASDLAAKAYMPESVIDPGHLPLTEGNQPLRPIQIPEGVFEEFIDIASNNTRANLETCGVLCGRQVPGQEALVMTTLIIPKQSATSDTCTTEHEEELFAEQMDRDLITLGWIHTHPTQTCFMSSLDLHTQCSYQIMLPEAIAIVCSPKQQQRFGIFRLTDPMGIDVIQNCKQKSAFHPHDESTTIYTNADTGGHVVLYNYDFDIIDIRDC